MVIQISLPELSRSPNKVYHQDPKVKNLPSIKRHIKIWNYCAACYLCCLDHQRYRYNYIEVFQFRELIHFIQRFRNKLHLMASNSFLGLFFFFFFFFFFFTTVFFLFLLPSTFLGLQRLLISTEITS
jgi:hypothetical protein